MTDDPGPESQMPPTPLEPGSPALSRRAVLGGTVGGLALVGLGGVLGHSLNHPTSSSLDVNELAEEQHFITRPDLRPPTVRFTSLQGNAATASAAPRFIFVSPRSVIETLHQLGVVLVPSQIRKPPSQPGLMILDQLGRMVYFKPVPTQNPFDFNMQLEGSTPRLTWWQGQITVGHGVGVGHLADERYATVNTVHAGHGLMTDCHELNLTSAGTALITAYQDTTADLSRVGGARQARVWAGHIQEIDLATGKVLFDWNSLEHVGVDESYTAVPGKKTAYDYFHINSIKELADGNLLVSARNTWACYKIDRSSGAVIWRMNGKRSDFTMDPGTNFYWQHDARMPDPATLTLFDDGAFPAEEKRSRGLVLSVDTTAMHVSLRQAFVHPAGFIAATQGSMELLADGNVLVGWGNQGYFTQFAPDGSIVFDGQFPPRVCSYRAFSHEWVGSPTESPAVVVRRNSSGGSYIYVSWNGATEVAVWKVLAGATPHALHTVGSQEWTGFETSISVNASGPYFVVVGLDKHGRELGRSEVTKMNGQTYA